MSAISLSIPPPSPIKGEPEKVAKDSPANDLAGYRTSTTRESEVRKSQTPANLNVRAKVWISRDLSTYGNSQYD